MKELKQKLLAAYGPDTAHPSFPFSPSNPTAGQCAITALLVYEIYGYDIYETKVGRSRHFFNKTDDGKVIDLTAKQFFDKVIPYDACRKREPKELYKSCGERLTILKSKMNEQE
ncbi:MAG: hypothetical protein IJZ68_06095 [Bacteroidaceae bacterium]|nr:hypothetical protein [Bacteroidaceae bacterium]